MDDVSGLKTGDVLVCNQLLAGVDVRGRTAAGRVYRPGDRVTVGKPPFWTDGGSLFVRVVAGEGVEFMILGKFLDPPPPPCRCDLFLGPCRCVGGQAELLDERRRLYGLPGEGEA